MVGIQAFVRWFVRRRQRGFLITREGGGGGRLGAIQTRWKEGLALLARSRLGAKGESRYALPWFVTMGSTGSGKSALLSRSPLAAPSRWPNDSITKG